MTGKTSCKQWTVTLAWTYLLVIHQYLSIGITVDLPSTVWSHAIYVIPTCWIFGSLSLYSHKYNLWMIDNNVAWILTVIHHCMQHSLTCAAPAQCTAAPHRKIVSNAGGLTFYSFSMQCLQRWLQRTLQLSWHTLSLLVALVTNGNTTWQRRKTDVLCVDVWTATLGRTLFRTSTEGRETHFVIFVLRVGTIMTEGCVL